MTLALIGWRMETTDWVALVAIVWLAVAIVFGTALGTFIDRAGKIADRKTRRWQPEWLRQRLPPLEDDDPPVVYRPPRD